MLVSSSGCAHSPMTLTLSGLSTVYGPDGANARVCCATFAPPARAVPSATAATAARTTPKRFTSLPPHLGRPVRQPAHNVGLLRTHRSRQDCSSRARATLRSRHRHVKRVRPKPHQRTGLNIPMLAAQRRELILHEVRNGHGAGVVALAQQFEVSEMTVRRDLARLAREGRLKRVHGGAIPEDGEPPFARIAVEAPDAKARIGRAAAELLADEQ